MSVGMQAERHALEGCVLEMSGKAAALGKWLVENEKKLVSGERSLCHHLNSWGPPFSAITIINTQCARTR